MAEDRRKTILKHLEGCGMEILAADRCRDALRILEANPDAGVVLTDCSLPDGDWATLLSGVAKCSGVTQVILCMRVADPMLWIDALEVGVYDVLVEPYEGGEVRRIVAAALGQNRRPPPGGRSRFAQRQRPAA